MKNDPFAKLSGLDQQLFSTHSQAGTQLNSGALAKKAPKSGKDERTSEGPDIPKYESTSHVTSQRPDEGTSVRMSERPAGRTKGRTVDRHPYDFYHDQVMWLNRMKVEIEERYEVQVTANAMVQLALDVLILDYRVRGRHSHLVSHLVFGRALGQDEKGETKERPDEGTSERTSGGS